MSYSGSDEDIEFLKKVSPVIMGAGIIACNLKNEVERENYIAQDSVSFAKALLKEINKTIYNL